jgi:ribonuclease D
MLLEDPEIIKAGVTPISDAKYLMQDYAIQMNGTFDLRFLAMMSQYKAQGLGSLSKAVIGVELDKDWRVRCSDWEIDELSSKQIEYASNDAYVAIEIFRKLYRIARPDQENAESIRKFCDGYTDMTFKNKLAQMNLDSSSVAAKEKKLLKKGEE